MPAAPLLMLPLRIETHLTEDVDSVLVVDIRAYPDQIHVDSARDTMSPEEAAALDELGKAETGGPEEFSAAYRRISTAFGEGRIDHLWQAHAESSLPPLSESDWNNAPMARCLPDRLVVVVRTADGREQTVTGEQLPDAIPMAPAGGDTKAFSGVPDDPLLWMSDFETARKMGLAIRVRFEEGLDFSTIVSVEVIGLPRNAPREDRRRFAQLIRAQRGSIGISMHPAGQPTKADVPALKFSSTRHSMTVEKALALERNSLKGHEQNFDGNAATEPCARLIWAAAMEPAMLHGWHLEEGQERAPADWLESLEDRFVNRLRPEGSFPVLSIGRQPYGLHVMRARDLRSEDPIAAAISDMMPDLAAAAESRRDALHERKGDWRAILDHLTRPDQSGAWRRRRIHPLVSWINLLLNTNISSSREIFRAPERRIEKLARFGVTNIGQQKIALTTIGDTATKLMDLPLVAPHAERSDTRLDSAELDALLTVSLETLYEHIRESNASSILYIMALTALRWGVLEYAAARESRGDRNAAFRLLGHHLGYNAKPPSWNELIETAFGRRAGTTSVADLLSVAPPRGDEEGRSARRLGNLIAALRDLQGLPKWQVHRGLAGAIDAASFRFDVWETAEAMADLDRHRARSPDDLSIGAYSFLEGNGLWPQHEPPVFRAAPSVEHAATAAALHQARDAFFESGEGKIAELELSAGTVQRALDLAAYLRRGLDPSEALGRLAEGIIAAAERSETTPAIARAVPLRGHAEPLDASPRIDGLRLLEHARDGTLGDLQADFDSGRQRLVIVLGDTVEVLAKALIETSDAYAHLCTAEGLHRLMNGRPEAAHAAFEALGGGGPPPQDFAVVDNMPTGHTLDSSVVLVSTMQPASAGTLDAVVPGLAAIVGTLLPPLSGKIRAGVETPTGLQSIHLDLAELDLTEFELTLAARPDNGRETVLRPATRIALAVRGVRGTLREVTLDRDADDWWWAAGRAAKLLIEARPLFPDDLPGALKADQDERDTMELGARVAAGDVIGALLQAAVDNFDTAPETAVRSLLRLGSVRMADALSEAILSEAPLDPEMSTRIREVVKGHLGQPSEHRMPFLLPGLPVPPRIRLTANQSRRDAAISSQSSVAEWIESLQLVQPALWPLADLMLAGADARLSTRAIQGAPGMLPRDIPDKWIGGQVDPANLAQSIDGVMLLSPGEVEDGEEIFGLHVASWREVLAGQQTDIGVAARMPAPPGRAPNALVLVTPPATGDWSDKTIISCLRHLNSQMKARSLDLQTLPGASPPRAGEPPSDNLGLFLPLLWMPPAPVRDQEF